MKRLVLLGATGSIGVQTVDVVRQHPDRFELVALSAGRNIKKLREILDEFPVSKVCVQNEADARDLQESYPEIQFFHGDEGLKALAAIEEYDVLVNALVGFVGFMPTLTAIQNHHDVALANKETLVVGGELIYAALKEYGQKLYPIDSEHSAIFQCLQGNNRSDLKRLIITASGGSFRTKTREELKDVTVEQALAHPNWAMGAKITIDSADMMNKGFEVMEAHWLFNVDYDDIDVLMHRESVIHSMVEYRDHSVIAQLGAPDMRLPIQYALSWPDRFDLEQNEPLDLAKVGELHFEKPDLRRFPLLGLAYEAGRKAGNKPGIMNAANEVANLAFRNGEIPFLKIEDIVISAVYKLPFKEVKDVNDLIEANEWGVRFANEMIHGEIEK